MSLPIAELLALLGAIDGLGTTVLIGSRFVHYIKKIGRERKATDIREFLENLGNTGEREVRQMVVDWDRSQKLQLTGPDREALIALLLNLTRKARFVTTHGAARSSLMRSMNLIEQLVSDIQPARKSGEPVAKNHDWILERYLGMGTFGEVWMAVNPGFHHRRAYKFFTRPNSLQWIRKEQQSLMAIQRTLGNHPNLIEFEDVAIENQATPFLALEYAGGGSLEDWILEDKEDRVPLNLHDVILGLASGLATAHEHDISHRDLKPANIVLTDGPHPVAKITDFGLGKVAAEVGAPVAATQGVLVGTPMYLPPEAMATWGDRLSTQDDVFALGVVWYQLLVEKLERPPYDFAEELRASGADSHTIGLISRCLARPENRFKDATVLLDSLDSVGLRDWVPPPGCFDVQHLFREYHAGQPG